VLVLPTSADLDRRSLAFYSSGEFEIIEQT
jgi:hypothetical protein